jgi:hypothetical protein
MHQICEGWKLLAMPHTPAMTGSWVELATQLFQGINVGKNDTLNCFRAAQVTHALIPAEQRKTEQNLRVKLCLNLLCLDLHQLLRFLDTLHKLAHVKWIRNPTTALQMGLREVTVVAG